MIKILSVENKTFSRPRDRNGTGVEGGGGGVGVKKRVKECSTYFDE